MEECQIIDEQCGDSAYRSQTESLKAQQAAARKSEAAAPCCNTCVLLPTAMDSPLSSYLISSTLLLYASASWLVEKAE